MRTNSKLTTSFLSKKIILFIPFLISSYSVPRSFIRYQKIGDMVEFMEIQKAEFKISGMTCAGCEIYVKAKLKKVNGLIHYSVSYDNRNAIVEFDTAKTSIPEIEKAIQSTGYKVTSYKIL